MGVVSLSDYLDPFHVTPKQGLVGRAQYFLKNYASLGERDTANKGLTLESSLE